MTGRQVCRQTDIQVCRQTDRQTNRHADIQTGTEGRRKTFQTDILTQIQTPDIGVYILHVSARVSQVDDIVL